MNVDQPASAKQSATAKQSASEEQSATAKQSARKAPRTALGWFWELARAHSPHYRLSNRTLAHPMPWPAGFDPNKNPVFSYNELDIPAPPSTVFATLTDATAWPSFYRNAADVVIEGGQESRLRAGARFHWSTFSTPQKSQVLLFEMDRALGWSADSPGTRAFHRWVLEASAEGTRLITEECQFGITASLDRYWMNRSLCAAHQIWLESLRGRIVGNSVGSS